MRHREALPADCIGLSASLGGQGHPHHGENHIGTDVARTANRLNHMHASRGGGVHAATRTHNSTRAHGSAGRRHDDVERDVSVDAAQQGVIVLIKLWVFPHGVSTRRAAAIVTDAHH